MSDKKSEIPAQVLQFIRKYIRSVWQLELILLIRASKEPINSRDISRSLYISSDLIDRALNAYAKQGLIKMIENEATTYKFEPADSQLSTAVELTAKAYAERRVAIINIIFSDPLDSFSDAFKFKQEDE